MLNCPLLYFLLTKANMGLISLNFVQMEFFFMLFNISGGSSLFVKGKSLPFSIVLIYNIIMKADINFKMLKSLQSSSHTGLTLKNIRLSSGFMEAFFNLDCQKVFVGSYIFECSFNMTATLEVFSQFIGGKNPSSPSFFLYLFLCF